MEHLFSAAAKSCVKELDLDVSAQRDGRWDAELCEGVLLSQVLVDFRREDLRLVEPYDKRRS